MKRWRSDVWIQAELDRRANERAARDNERVKGKRVVVAADLDYGREGTIVGFVDGMYQVVLDGEEDAHFFNRDELARAS